VLDPSSSLQRAGRIVVVGEMGLEAGAQERAEAPLCGIVVREKPFSTTRQEEALRQVLRVPRPSVASARGCTGARAASRLP
jgi:hypothetical protein